MTSVNISSVTNTVVVDNSGDTTVVTVSTVGPQGPSGILLDETAKVDKSVVYYDATAATFKADALWTVPTLSDGGNY
jgi:hypothetical protein